jgi:hypothetical protein
MSNKPVYELYTLLNVAEDQLYYNGYFLLNGKYPSFVQFRAIQVTEADGSFVAETKNSFYKLVQVEKYPEWAVGENRYVAKPDHIKVVDEGPCKVLVFTRGGERCSEYLSGETDEYWEAGATRYLKQ